MSPAVTIPAIRSNLHTGRVRHSAGLLRYGFFYEFWIKSHEFRDWRKGRVGISVVVSIWMVVEIIAFGAVGIIVLQYAESCSTLSTLRAQSLEQL